LPEPDEQLRVLVVIGTTRDGRFGSHIRSWVLASLRRRPGFDVDVLDLRDHPLPFFDGIPPARAPREYANDAVATVGRQIDAADAYVVVTGEYNHGYPAVLKNLLDWTFPEWQRKPVGFVGWGNVGGARAIEQLREVVIEMEMAPIRFAVHVLPTTMIAVRSAEDTEWPADAPVFADLAPRMDLLVEDLTWWAVTLKAGRMSP
jgi:NAD(P)H-dependent FMN reductase